MGLASRPQFQSCPHVHEAYLGRGSFEIEIQVFRMVLHGNHLLISSNTKNDTQSQWIAWIILSNQIIDYQTAPIQIFTSDPSLHHFH